MRTGRAGGALRSTWFAQRQFPRWAKADRLDVFWSPRHQLPLLLPNEIKCVVTLHDLIFRTHPKTMRTTGRLLEALLTPPSLTRADAVITDSLAVQQELAHYYPKNQNKSQAIHLSSSLAEHYDPECTPRLDALGKAPYFVFSGSVEPRKNLNRLLRAFFELVNTQGIKQHLVLISGGGWQNADTMQLIDQLGNRVHLFCGVDERQKATLFAGADFIALPSLHEGFGLPIVEALKMGKPVLTSSSAAMPEVAGSAGEYVDPNSEASIKAGLLRLCENPAHLAKLSGAATEEAKRFDWLACAEATLSVLENVAASQRSER